METLCFLSWLTVSFGLAYLPYNENEFVTLVLLYVFAPIIGAIIAKRKSRTMIGWGLTAFVVPLSLLILFALPYKNRS